MAQLRRNRIPRFIAAVGAASQQGLNLIGLTYVNNVKTAMINSPRSGAIRRRGRKFHKASGPGEPPAPDRGTLLRSVRFKVVKLGGRPPIFALRVGSTLKDIPRFLEFGTRRMRPRPVWRPQFKRIQKQIRNIMRDSIVKTVPR